MNEQSQEIEDITKEEMERFKEDSLRAIEGVKQQIKRERQTRMVVALAAVVVIAVVAGIFVPGHLASVREKRVEERIEWVKSLPVYMAAKRSGLKGNLIPVYPLDNVWVPPHPVKLQWRFPGELQASILTVRDEKDVVLVAENLNPGIGSYVMDVDKGKSYYWNVQIDDGEELGLQEFHVLDDTEWEQVKSEALEVGVGLENIEREIDRLADFTTLKALHEILTSHRLYWEADLVRGRLREVFGISEDQ